VPACQACAFRTTTVPARPVTRTCSGWLASASAGACRGSRPRRCEPWHSAAHGPARAAAPGQKPERRGRLSGLARPARGQYKERVTSAPGNYGVRMWLMQGIRTETLQSLRKIRTCVDSVRRPKATLMRGEEPCRP
jgi:hypothetical protein